MVTEQLQYSSPKPHYQPPLSIREAYAALSDIKNLLEPQRKNGKGRLPFKGSNILRSQTRQMQMLLYKYTTGMSTWTAASLEVVQSFEKGEYHARKL
jgi:hypothetical protein